MASRFRVSVEGGEELARRLSQLSESMSGAVLVEATLAGAGPIKETASQRAPRDEGRLSRSIDAEVVKAEPRRAAVHVGPNRNAFYGMFVELGTRHIAAKPFLRPAFDMEKDKAVEAIADHLRTALALRG